MKVWKIITDGAYSSSRDQGGVGIVILEDGNKLLEYSNKYEHTTNNQMELGAIIIALRLVKNPLDKLIIYTDSQYCIGCATLGWQRKKNKKLWTEFDSQMQRISSLCSNVEFIHVKGHQTDNSEETKWNNYVDNLAVKASKLL